MEVEPDDLDSVAGEFRGLVDPGDALVDLAKDANPDPTTWGLAGIPFAMWYGSSEGEVITHMENMVRAFEGHASRLESCAEKYRKQEKDTQDVMDEIRSQIDEGGAWTQVGGE